MTVSSILTPVYQLNLSCSMCIMQTQITNAVIKKRIIKYDFMKNLKTISLLTFLSFVSISVNLDK